MRTNENRIKRKINRFIRYLTIGLFITLLFACNSHKNSSENATISNFFDEVELGAFGSDTKLLINASFSECGEWGGRNENIIIYANKVDKEIYLNYRKYKVNCDSISTSYGTPYFQKIDSEKTIQLNQENKKSISRFIQRMIKSKIEERFPGHAGNSFSVLKTDSTLLIKVYDNKTYDTESYYKLLVELNLLESQK
jgi:hypothetical protein